MNFQKIKPEVILIIIILLGAILRFYKLDWGEGLFAHPDEYHIVISVNQLSFPSQMHPHFFSYGTTIIYLIYFTKQIVSLFFEINTFLIGRFFSATFSTLTIFIVYLLVRNVLSIRFSLISAFLVAITPGLSLGVKTSGVVFVPTIIIAIITKTFKKPLLTLSLFISSGVIILITLAIVAPYIFLDFPAFKGNLEYEGGLAAGKFPVFYTRQFINTTPIIFQLERILPYALGPSLLITSLIGFIVCIFSIIKKPPIKLFIITVAFICLFGFNVGLFAKWTRFIVPTLPFFPIFVSFFLDKLYSKNRFVSNLLTAILLVTTMLWTCAFFSIYLRPDVRVTASNWIEGNTSKDSIFLVEGGNMVDIPLKGGYKRISLDFYTLEEDKQTRLKIAEGLKEADYFLIQSRRVFLNHQRLFYKFPKTAQFYDALFDGRLGFKQIKQFDSYPRLSLFGFTIKSPDEEAEETWSVFDHPVIRVFQKNVKLNKEQYAKFLE